MLKENVYTDVYILNVCRSFAQKSAFKGTIPKGYTDQTDLCHVIKNPKDQKDQANFQVISPTLSPLFWQKVDHECSLIEDTGESQSIEM